MQNILISCDDSRIFSFHEVIIILPVANGDTANKLKLTSCLSFKQITFFFSQVKTQGDEFRKAQIEDLLDRKAMTGNKKGDSDFTLQYE